MSRKSFHNILTRYLKGSSSEDEKKLVEQWYLSIDEKGLANNDLDIEELEDKLWDKVKTEISAGPDRKSISLWGKVSAAAAIAFMIFSVGILLYGEHKSPQFLKNKAFITQTNNGPEISKILFEDGSSVVLKPGALVKYPLHFSASKREIYLDGEGFFEISKNPERPFYIFSNNIITQVVGTSFTIKSTEAGDHSEVVVNTGKVLVTENPKGLKLASLLNKKEVYLTPNLKTVYSENEGDFTMGLAEKPVQITSTDKKTAHEFVFNDTPLTTVFGELQTTYGIEIIAPADKITACTFTGDIRQNSLYQKLDFICQSVGAVYKIKATKIYIYGNGCN